MCYLKIKYFYLLNQIKKNILTNYFEKSLINRSIIVKSENFLFLNQKRVVVCIQKAIDFQIDQAVY